MDADRYTRLRARELYRNAYLTVEVHEILHPNGVAGEHLAVRTPQPCAIVVEDGDALLFAVQPRFASRRSAIEVVKGGRDPGESALQCAQRELGEELGVTARTWTELGRLYEIPSIVEEPVTLFLARDLGFGAARPEAGENIEIARIPIAAALERAATGVIDDAVTVGALLRYGFARGVLEVR